MAYIEARIEESLTDARLFEESHAELMRRWAHAERDYPFGRSLTDAEIGEVEWFDEELGIRLGRTRIFRERLRFARDAAGVEPYYPTDQDDD